MRVMRVFAGNPPTTHEKCQRQKNIYELKKPRYHPHYPQPEAIGGSSLGVSLAGAKRRGLLLGRNSRR